MSYLLKMIYILTKVTGYENSKHLMTVGKDRLQIQDDILTFLESLDW